MWTLSCDATALPGRFGLGAVLVSPDGERHTLTRVIVRRGCSNEAEALALIAGLEEAARLGASEVDVRCDSTILIAQTIGDERTKIERLARVFALARERIASFSEVRMQWVPRHRNTEADTLARGALGLPPKTQKKR